jgi:hypothetical protein
MNFNIFTIIEKRKIHEHQEKLSSVVGVSYMYCLKTGQPEFQCDSDALFIYLLSLSLFLLKLKYHTSQVWYFKVQDLEIAVFIKPCYLLKYIFSCVIVSFLKKMC